MSGPKLLQSVATLEWLGPYVLRLDASAWRYGRVLCFTQPRLQRILRAAAIGRPRPNARTSRCVIQRAIMALAGLQINPSTLIEDL